MSYQYRAYSRGDDESSCIHYRHARKKKIARRFKLEDPKFDGYSDLRVFSDWLGNMKCYFDWYEFLKASPIC